MKKPSPPKLAQLSLFLVFLFTPSLAHAARVERLIDTWQPKHYVVNITLNDRLSEIASATARVDVVVLKRTALIDLDFGAMTIDAVTVDSKPATFTHKDGKLNVNLAAPAAPGTRLQISVQYRGKPTDGLIFSTDKDGKPSAVGDNWPNRVHHWIPTFDHPRAGRQRSCFQRTFGPRTNKCERQSHLDVCRRRADSAVLHDYRGGPIQALRTN